MRVFIAGGEGLRSSKVQTYVDSLTTALRDQGHTVLHCGPSRSEGELYELGLQRIHESDLVVAFVEELTVESGIELQEAVRVEKPVLGLTENLVPVSAYLVGMEQTKLIDIAAFDCLDAVVEMVGKRLMQVQAKAAAQAA